MASTHQHTVDSRSRHRAPGSAAVTADMTLANEAQQASTRTCMVTVIEVTAITATSNQVYDFQVEVSDTSAFTTYQVAAFCSLGHTSAKKGGGATTAAGHRAEIFWCTEVSGTQYRYWRIRLVTAGTSPSITFSSFTAPTFGN